MRRWMIVTLVVVALAAGLAGPARAQEDACFERGGWWDAETGECTLRNGLDLTMQYPTELLEYEFAAATVDDFLTTARDGFIQRLLDEGFMPTPGYMWGLNVEYALFHYGDDVVSIEFSLYEYTGGAHGMTTFQTFVFDTSAETVLALEDVFQPGTDPLAVIAPLAEQAITAQLEAMGAMGDAEWIATGTAPDPINYRNWVPTEEGLRLTFEPYQVAPYAVGPQAITIPWADLAGSLSAAFAAG